MGDLVNFVDEKNTRKIVNAICDLDFLYFNKLANDSKIPVTRLLSFIDGSEMITMIEKDQLIPHLTNLADMSEDKSKLDEETVESFTALNDFLKYNAG
jgi:hypothetical protein